MINYLARVRAYDPFTTLLQLVIIGLAVWWVLRFLRGTRGARLVKGAGLLLVMAYVSIRLLPTGGEWDRLEVLYSRFLFFAFLAMVVVFQPELRRALMQLGQTKLFHVQASRVEAMIGQLCQSVAYLSRNKIGALIAIERQVGLGALVETGVPIEAALTAELLNTIFYPGSTLHDLGVVIQNGRISAAGVQFPLAESYATDRSLGSRHRAALGLSEECDAIVLVLSEETGRISLAYDGQLSVGVPVDGLRELLEALLRPRTIGAKKAGVKDRSGDERST
ncbi:MAG: TIGR00159 family protein [Planctomycetes bacterium]|nr:TIGR00159 family protein [Planctomycetota bacterium]